MVTKLKYSEEGFTIVADDTADLLKVFDHVMEGPQVVEVRNNVTVDGPSPWATPVLYEPGELPVATGTVTGASFTFDEIRASDAPLIGEELLAKSGISVKVDEDGKSRVVVEANQFVVETPDGAVLKSEPECGSVQPIEPIVTTTDVVVKRKKTKAAPLADGWIEWNQPLYEGYGGPAGIEDGALLKVRVRSGTEMDIEMGTLDSYWTNDDTAIDIIAYRVIA
jgi:hypothetical protein